VYNERAPLAFLRHITVNTDVSALLEYEATCEIPPILDTGFNCLRLVVESKSLMKWFTDTVHLNNLENVIDILVRRQDGNEYISLLAVYQEWGTFYQSICGKPFHQMITSLTSLKLQEGPIIALLDRISDVQGKVSEILTGDQPQTEIDDFLSLPSGVAAIGVHVTDRTTFSCVPYFMVKSTRKSVSSDDISEMQLKMVRKFGFNLKVVIFVNIHCNLDPVYYITFWRECE
jgi:hypothetical protein